MKEIIAISYKNNRDNTKSIFLKTKAVADKVSEAIDIYINASIPI